MSSEFASHRERCCAAWRAQQAAHRRLAGPFRGLISFAVVALLTLVSAAAWAQDAEIKLRVDRNTLSEDDQLTVRVIASGAYDEVVAPTSDGFDFTSAGRSSQVSIIGSHMQRSDTYTYVGRPRRQGKHTISPAMLRSRGRVVARSPAVEIVVTSAREALGKAVTPEAAADPRRLQGEAFFVLPQLSTPKPFAGQPFVMTFQLFWSRRVHVTNIRELSGPKYGGFEVEDLLGGRPREQEPTRLGGAPYFRQTTRQVLLTAAAPGKFEVLGPRYRVEAGDIFSQRAYKVGPPPIAIEVRPVPREGRPVTFADGNIGSLELDGWLLDRDRPVRQRKVQVGERVVLHLEVRGAGNLFGIEPLKPPQLAGMRIQALPSRPDEHVKTSANGTEGKRIWQHVLTFEHGGRFELPALKFAAFDPFEERFVESTAGPFVVEVDGPAPATGQPSGASKPGSSASSLAATPPATTGVRPEPVALPKGDPWQRLRPIAAQARLAQTSAVQWTELPWFWRLAGLPWALGLLFGLGRFGARWRQAGAGQRRRDNALELAERAIDQARSQGKDGYRALRDAVAVYLDARAGLRPGGLTWAELSTALRRHGGAEQAVAAVVAGLEQCDAMQYAPMAGQSDLDTVADRLMHGLRALDQTLSSAEKGRDLGKKAGLVLLLAGPLAAALLGAPGTARAGSVDDAFTAANRAYVKGDYEQARRAYEDLLRHDLPAAAIHYNLGNTLVRTGRLGEAIGHFKQAQRMEPDERLAADIAANLKLVRDQLAERSRRRHRILHIFDQSAEVDVALARAAPTTLLGVLTLAGGFAAFLLLLIIAWPGRPPTHWSTRATLAAALVVHVGAGGWLWHAQRVEDTVRYSVVVQEDAPLSPCSGVGETVDLPEGLEVRQLRTRPDGRIEVRLPNGRSGCMKAQTLYGTG